MPIMKYFFIFYHVWMAQRCHDSSIFKSGAHGTHASVPLHLVNLLFFNIFNFRTRIFFDIVNLLLATILSILVISEVYAFGRIDCLIMQSDHLEYLAVGTCSYKFDVRKVFVQPRRGLTCLISNCGIKIFSLW